MDTLASPKDVLGAKIKEQISRLAAIQYLIWQKELPEGFNREAVEYSFCYHLLEIPFYQKLSRFSLGLLQAMVGHLAKKYELPGGIAELKMLEKSFRLEIEGKRYPVSDCGAVNELLSESGSPLRLCSGFYGPHKFYILGEASEKREGDYTVYRLKKEVAVTPGCHLLMAAMVGGKNVFLREASARFLFYQKWRTAFNSSEKLEDKIKKSALEQFGIQNESDFKSKAKNKKLMAAFMDNLFFHELNHSSVEAYIRDEELLGIAQASIVLQKNVLSHLLEVFTDWLPGKGSISPLQKIFEAKDLGQLTLYIADNWFYESSFPEQHIYSSLDLAPLMKHLNAGKVSWQGLIKEIKDQTNGSLLYLYRSKFEEIAKRLRQIVEESQFILTDRPVSYHTIATYAELDIKKKNKNVGASEYQVTFWSNVFNYLKSFSKEGYACACKYLQQAEKELEQEVIKKIGGKRWQLKDVIIEKTQEIFAR